MEDLLSGTVSGAFYLGGGAAPALAGTINSLFGFGWACTGMGFLMLLEAIALLVLLLFLRRPPDKASQTNDEEQAPAQHDGKLGVDHMIVPLLWWVLVTHHARNPVACLAKHGSKFSKPRISGHSTTADPN